MNALSLFSGIGAHDLGLERAGMRTVAFCESDPWCRAVLAKHWPGVPCHPDVRRLSGRDVPGVDLITGGFPCTDLSVAGKGAGLGTEDQPTERSGLWFEYLRLVRELRPRWVLAENVPALRSRGFDTVAAGLEAEGYAVWPLVVGAWAVGAPHRRERVWIVGHANTARRERAWTDAHEGRPGLGDGRSGLGNPNGPRLALDLSERGDTREERAATVGAGGEGLADSDRGRLEGERIEERAGIEGASRRELDGRDDDGRQRGEGLADPEDGGRQGEGQRRGPQLSGLGSTGARWPAGRGAEQFDWEAPRLVEPGVGRTVAGTPRGLDGFARRNRLRALGNANPPQAIEAIGRWILNGEAA